MFRGETVTVETKVVAGKDTHGNAVYELISADVSNVLIAVGATTEVADGNRENGVKVVYKLYFPKTFGGSLEGARINVYGEWFDVIGDPRPWLNPMTPTEWNRVVEVTAYHG